MKYFFAVLAACSLIGCAQGNCRSQISAPAAKGQADASMKSSSNPNDRVRVFKYDGSLQCGKGKAIAAEVMAKDLKDIKVYSFGSKADGLMHIQMCGTPTGKANVYEIDSTDLAAAQKLGFQQWTWD